MELKDRIKKAMIDAGLSPADVTRKTGITSGAITQWTDGTTKSLRFVSAKKLASITGFNAMWIADGTGDMYPTPALPAPVVQNQPVAHAHYEKHAINPESLHNALVMLHESLNDVDNEANKQLIGSMLHSMATSPLDKRFIGAIELLLTPLHHDDLQKKSA
jgi:transcriptional regulator with XRE-family HTH domain